MSATSENARKQADRLGKGDDDWYVPKLLRELAEEIELLEKRVAELEAKLDNAHEFCDYGDDL